MSRRKSQRLQNKGISGRSAEENHSLLTEQLREIGLRVKDVPGDGNCLFRCGAPFRERLCCSIDPAGYGMGRALGDQLEGDMESYARHRQEVCDYLESQRDHFQVFISDEDNSHGTFDQHLKLMRQPSTYGGNIELVAFARLHRVDIWVHQAGRPVFSILGCEDGNREDAMQVAERAFRPRRRILHLAYHSYEHYSSIRPLDGPLEGVPDIRIDPMLLHHSDDSVSESKVPNTAEKMIQLSTGCQDLQRIRRMMVEKRGNVDDVVEALILEMNEALEGSPPDPGTSPAPSTGIDPASRQESPRVREPIPPPRSPLKSKHTRQLSARERKEQAKKERKRKKLEKERHTVISQSPGISTKLSVLHI